MKSVALAGVILYLVGTAIASPVLQPLAANSLDLINHDDFSPNCPPGFSQPQNTNWSYCYKIFNSFKSKQAAMNVCQSNNGTLASISDSFVNSYLYSIASQNGATAFWLGIQCYNGDVNTCKNDDQKLFSYNNFYPGQPTADGVCVYVSTIGRDSQKWMSFDCDQTFQFACEVPSGVGAVTTTTQSTAPTTPNPNLKCPQGYAWFQGMCYTKNDVVGGDTRDEESVACRKVPGGFLATIGSDAVDNFIEYLYCKNPFFRFGLTCPNVKYDGDTSSCVWDDGQPFVYHKFGPEYPRANTNNPCIYEYGGTWLNDDSEKCNDAFICSACQAPPMKK